jgi:hypothetical protein
VRAHCRQAPIGNEWAAPSGFAWRLCVHIAGAAPKKERAASALLGVLVCVRCGGRAEGGLVRVKGISAREPGFIWAALLMCALRVQ